MTLFTCPWNSRCSPELRSQSRTTPSSPPVSARFPSGEYAADLISFSWSNERISCRVSRSHSPILLIQPQVKTRRPSGETKTVLKFPELGNCATSTIGFCSPAPRTGGNSQTRTLSLVHETA